jgi:hypothetical protein
MVLVTIALLAAPVARLPLAILQAGPPAFFGLADLLRLLLPCVVYDLVTGRRIHPATAWGGLLSWSPSRCGSCSAEPALG